MKEKEKLFFIPLGGCSEIGMNMYVYGYDNGREVNYILVDAGVTFPDPENTPGVDLIMPDTSFIENNISNFKAIFITHAHEDHIGSLTHLFEYIEAPIYCGKFTALIAKSKISKGGGNTKLVKIVDHYPKMIKVGFFKVGFVNISHSIPEASGLVIETPCSRIFHSGDFKVDHSPVLGKPFNNELLSKIGKKGINILVCDSTNVFNEHKGRSEASLLDNFVKLFMEVKGVIVATTFASNLARLKTLASAAYQSGRSLVVLGRAMNNMIKYGKESGILKDFPDILSPRDAKLVPKSHLLVLASGSQGEPRAASAQLAREGYMGFTIGKGDVFLFSSKTIPGNELRVSYIIDQLERKEVQVIEDKNGLFHVSGHANKPDLKIFHNLISPDLFIPMHGEFRHLKEHIRIAKDSGIKTLLVQNGDVAQISNSASASIIDKVEYGRIFLDGSVLIDEEEGVVSERKKLMYNGIVNVSILINNISPYTHFELNFIGVSTTIDFKNEVITHLEDEINFFINNKIKSLKNCENYLFETEVRRILNKFFKNEIGKKPQISICIHRMDIM